MKPSSACARSMAAEFAQFGIRVNALAPGTTDTDMVRASIRLLKRMAEPDEI